MNEVSLLRMTELLGGGQGGVVEKPFYLRLL